MTLKDEIDIMQMTQMCNLFDYWHTIIYQKLIRIKFGRLSINSYLYQDSMNSENIKIFSKDGKISISNF